MNRTISLHPLSLVAGLVAGVLILVSMSQTPVLNARGAFIEYMPHPRDMVQIRGGAPYVVPAGKIFTLTSLQYSTDELNNRIQVRVDDQPELLWYSPVSPVPPGFTVAAGHSITLIELYNGTSHPTLRAWGYLANQ